MIRVSHTQPVRPRALEPRRAHRTPHHLGKLFAALGVVASFSCDGPVAPLQDRVVGYINFADIRGHEPGIPGTATAGVPLPVTVWTMGDGCREGGDTEVDVDGLTAVVTPYDIQIRSTGGCTEELRRFEHTATVVFDVPGTAEVLLRYSTSYGEYSANARKVFSVEVSSGD